MEVCLRNFCSVGKSASTLEQERRQQWWERGWIVFFTESHLLALPCKHGSWSCLPGGRAHFWFWAGGNGTSGQGKVSSPPQCPRRLPTLVYLTMAFRDPRALPVGFLTTPSLIPVPPALPPSPGPLHFLPQAQGSSLQDLPRLAPSHGSRVSSNKRLSERPFWTPPSHTVPKLRHPAPHFLASFYSSAVSWHLK